MKDTIGAHMAEAMRSSQRAAYYHERAICQDSPTGRVACQRHAAHHEGAAAGHIVRALHLAHDAGNLNGMCVTANHAFRSAGLDTRLALAHGEVVDLGARR